MLVINVLSKIGEYYMTVLKLNYLLVHGIAGCLCSFMQLSDVQIMDIELCDCRHRLFNAFIKRPKPNPKPRFFENKPTETDHQ